MTSPTANTGTADCRLLVVVGTTADAISTSARVGDRPPVVSRWHPVGDRHVDRHRDAAAWLYRGTGRRPGSLARILDDAAVWWRVYASGRPALTRCDREYLDPRHYDRFVPLDAFAEDLRRDRLATVVVVEAGPRSPFDAIDAIEVIDWSGARSSGPPVVALTSDGRAVSSPGSDHLVDRSGLMSADALWDVALGLPHPRVR